MALESHNKNRPFRKGRIEKMNSKWLGKYEFSYSVPPEFYVTDTLDISNKDMKYSIQMSTVGIGDKKALKAEGRPTEDGSLDVYYVSPVSGTLAYAFELRKDDFLFKLKLVGNSEVHVNSPQLNFWDTKIVPIFKRIR